ncbi:MAG: oligosaccharide flippase family protein [Clostridia bacterium]|nr:oligosaccharide flippase family protein [Clostridia bacterium]
MKKQVYINLIAQIIAFVVNMGISFFLTPYIVNHLGIEANGFVGLANNFVEYAQLITVALNSMAGRFITIKIHQNNEEDANRYFTSVFFANLFLSVILTVVFIFVIIFLGNIINISQNIIVDIKILWIFIFANFILSLFTSIFSVATFVKDRLDLTAIANIRGMILRALVLVGCYVFLPSYTFYVGVATLVLGLNNLISNIIYKRKLTPNLRINKKYFSYKYLKELLASGIWNSVNKLSSILSSGLDLLITNIFINPVAMGIMNLSKTVSNIVLSLFGTLASIFAPQLTIAFAKGDSEEMKKQLISSIKLMGLFSAIPIAILIAYGKSFYELWVPAQNASLLELLTIITSFNLIFALPLEPLYNIFTVKNKIKISSIALIIFSSLSISTVFIGLNFIHNENAKIIYIASVGAFYNIVRVLTFLPIYGAKCLGFKKTTFYPAILKNTISVAILVVIAFMLNLVLNVNSWIKMIVACIIVGIIGLVINIFILFDKDERKENLVMIQGIFSKLKKV